MFVIALWIVLSIKVVYLKYLFNFYTQKFRIINNCGLVCRRESFINNSSLVIIIMYLLLLFNFSNYKVRNKVIK